MINKYNPYYVNIATRVHAEIYKLHTTKSLKDSVIYSAEYAKHNEQT